MKNLNYFPFARSRYFYGKLLTVDDLETEQKYMNDKRRMINRFLHGTGVVCGMNVVQVDDRTVSVEMGLALDFAGREIVVDTPIIRKLDMIEGFDDSADDGYLYLCIAYNEEETEPVHSIAGSHAAGNMDYNKYAEGYRIFFTAQEPEQEGLTAASAYQDTKTVYWGNGIRVKQSLHRFLKAGGESALTVTVENMGQQQPFTLDYDVALTCLQHEGEDRVHVHFDERDFPKAGRYQVELPLTVMDVRDAEGSAKVVPDSLKLTVGGREIAAQAAGTNQCRVTAGSAEKAVMDQYYRTAMDDIVRNTYQQSIYLAKIALIKAGPSYYIESVENMPFNQYVFNGQLSSAMNDLLLEALDRRQGGSVAPAAAAPKAPRPSHSVASGSVVLDLGIGGGVGKTFFSEEISHGLGLGPVNIQLGLACGVSDDAPIVCGSPEIFEIPEGEANGELAAKVDVTKGTFVIGLRLTSLNSVRSVRVYWTAYRDNREDIHDREQQALFIRPDVSELEVRETQYFQAVFENVSDQRVRWSVKEPQGGAIDENGMYTAPNTVGVYEITAESVAHPELRASTYVVVRDPGQEQ